MVAKIKIVYSLNGQCDFHIDKKNNWTNPTITKCKSNFEICIHPKSTEIFRHIFLEIVFICLLAQFDLIEIIEDDCQIMKKNPLPQKK